jgi:hypothetical protein
MSDSVQPPDRPEQKEKPPQAPTPAEEKLSEKDAREGMIDFDHTVGSGRGGTSSLNLGRVSEPLSGGSIVSWAELLRQQQVKPSKPSDPDVVVGSLPEIQIDAPSDNDILRHLENEGVRVPPPAQSGQMRPPMPSKSAQGSPMPPVAKESSSAILRPGKSGQGIPIPAASGSVIPFLTQQSPISDSMIARRAPAQPADKGDWMSDAPAAAGEQSSSIDLRTAASSLAEGSRSRLDESDVLAHALAQDDGGSAVNLGVEPRVNNLMSNPSLLQKVAAMRGAVPGAMPPAAQLAPPAPARARTPQQLVGWIGGAAIGVAIATGFAFVAGVFKQPIVQQQVVGTGTGSGATKPGEVAGPDLARQLLESGEPDQALAAFTACPDSAQVLAGRGQARWLAYIRQQRRNKAPLADQDEAVTRARTELQNAHLPEATLWLGLLDETLGHFDAARATYLRGRDEHAEQRRVFDAALARLDTLTGQGPKDRAAHADPQLGLALSMLLIQAGAAEPEEAGFDYWQAMQLARKRDYAGARDALKRAKAAHDERRAVSLRRGLNPMSDPREDIFLHSCDQLLVYWEMQSRLHSGGYDPDAPAADTIGTLVESRKRFDDAVKAVSTRLKTDRMENFAPALDALIAERKKAEDEYQRADRALRSAKQDLSTTSAALEEARKAVGDDAKTAQAKLEAAKAREAEARKALADLAAARRANDEVMQTLTEKLRAAKLVDDSAQSRDVLAAVDNLILRRSGSRALLTGANDPDLAERNFSAGLQFYFGGRFDAAESAFESAVGHNGKDARYHYFLGLSRWPQGKSEAAEEDFRQAAALEQLGLPDGRSISRSLERIQGWERQLINRFRQ